MGILVSTRDFGLKVQFTLSLAVTRTRVIAGQPLMQWATARRTDNHRYTSVNPHIARCRSTYQRVSQVSASLVESRARLHGPATAASAGCRHRLPVEREAHVKR